jgi:hypothetical protein
MVQIYDCHFDILPPPYRGAIPRACSIGVMSGSLPRKALNIGP